MGIKYVNDQPMGEVVMCTIIGDISLPLLGNLLLLLPLRMMLEVLVVLIDEVCKSSSLAHYAVLFSYNPIFFL